MIIGKRIKLVAGGRTYHLSPPPTLLMAAEGKLKPQDEQEEEAAAIASLIPGLPDHVAQICLSKLPPSLLFSVCSSWRRFIYSPLFHPFHTLYILSAPSASAHHRPIATPISLLNFDPVSSLRPTSLHRILTRPYASSSAILPSSVATSQSNLSPLATPPSSSPPPPSSSTPPSPARLSFPLSSTPPIPGPTDPPSLSPAAGAPRELWRGQSSWRVGSAAASRETGVAREAPMTVASTGSGGGGGWEKLAGSRTRRFCREAIEAVGWKGKLWWRGPAAAMEEEVIYVVDESCGVLRRYDEDGDRWVDVLESDRLRRAQHVAASGGRVRVVSSDGGGGGVVVVVDVTVAPPRLVVVDMPSGFDALTVHVLPRMSTPEFMCPVQQYWVS
ncbi:hypothetical protein Dimus_030107 [Dionaea muscipula]